MTIFQKSLPRRTFLRGVGATLALPLLDAMVPAVIGVVTGPRRLGADPPAGVRLRAERGHPGAVGACRDRPGLPVLADPEPARAVPRADSSC